MKTEITTLSISQIEQIRDMIEQAGIEQVSIERTGRRAYMVF